MNKQTKKSALLVALGVASVTVTQAQSDMLLGFNDAGANNGTTSYQNDYVIDLGGISGFTTTSSLSTTINQTTFDAAFVTPDANWANEVAVGVVGEDHAVTPKQVYVSGLTTPNAVATTRFNNILADASSIAVGEYTTASGGPALNGWTYNVGVAPGDPGTLNGNPTAPGIEVAAQGVSPLEFLSGGDATFNLYEATSIGTSHSFTEIGTITVNANDGVDTINYDGVDGVPEPATYGLFAGAGILLLSFYRQFIAKSVNDLFFRPNVCNARVSI